MFRYWGWLKESAADHVAESTCRALKKSSSDDTVSPFFTEYGKDKRGPTTCVVPATYVVLQTLDTKLLRSRPFFD